MHDVSAIGCAKFAEVEGRIHLVPGSEKHRCTQCGEWLALAPSSVRLLAQGIKPYCFDCISIAGSCAFVMTQEAAKELKQMEEIN